MDNKLMPVKIILVLIVMLCFGVVMGVIGYSLSLKKNPPVAVQPTIEPTINPTPTPAVAPMLDSTTKIILSPFSKFDTSDWEIYKSKKYEYGFRFPAKYKMDKNYSIWASDDGGEWGVNKEQETIFGINAYPKADKAKVLNGYKINDNREMLIDGITAKKLEGDTAWNALMVEKGDYIYIIISSFFPNTDSEEYNEYETILSTFKFIVSPPFDGILTTIPFHNSNKILQVRATSSGLNDDICNNTDDNPYCITKGLSVWGATIGLTVYNPKDQSSVFLGSISSVSYTGNSGGLFVPFAITKDDKNIILEAYMGDPGAGGGSTVYGDVTIPVKPAPSEDWAISEFVPVANWSGRGGDIPLAGDSTNFYDSYGKVVYVDEGSSGPHYDPPPYQSNDGALMFHDLVTGETKKLLEEVDTSYEITAVDEKNGILKFKATKYTYPEGCDRETPVLYSDCVKGSIVERSMPLP